MNELKVRIERLEPMRVAKFRAISRNPEPETWAMLKNWAEPRGLLSDVEAPPIYGFNNPNPSAEGKEYGYELRMRLSSEAEAQGGVEVQEFPGGRYAVITHSGLPNPVVWRKLWDWVQASPYRWRKTHELERMHHPWASAGDRAFDLYLPLED